MSFEIPHDSYLVFAPQGLTILNERAFNSTYERVRKEKEPEIPDTPEPSEPVPTEPDPTKPREGV